MSERWRTLLTAVLAIGVAVAAYVGPVELTVAAIVVGLAVAVGWPQLVDIPNKVSAAVTIGLMVAVATVIVWFTDDAAPMTWLPLVLGLSVLAAFGREMLRPAPRARLVDSVTAVVCGIVVGTFTTGWIAVDRSEGSVALTIAGAAAVAASSLLGALPIRGWARAAVMLAAATATGGAMTFVVPGAALVSGLLAGFLLGIVVAAVHRLTDRIPGAAKPVAALAWIATPVSAGGMAVYVITLIGNTVSLP